MFKKLFFAALFCLVTSLTASAEIQEKALTLTPFISGHIFEGNLNLDASQSFGVGLGYNLTEQWAIEGVFSRTDAEGAGQSSDATIKTYHLDALYHLWPNQAFTLYTVAGIGGIYNDFDHADDSHHLLLNYGAGFKYFILDDLIAFRAEVRHLLEFPEPDNSLQYSVGLTFQLGRPNPASKP